MTLLTKFQRHADLFRRMADTVDADLGSAAIAGRLPEHELRNAISHCMGCSDEKACAGWLDDHADGAGATPGYCRNQALFQRLATG